MLVLEGIARHELNYHTPLQIIIGAIIGVIFFFIFEYAWGLCESAIPNFDE
jgi:acid phosphatase family membrane protein YuiD